MNPITRLPDPNPGSPSRRFFHRDALTVARGLLGAILVHETPEGVTAGRIVEVEAYRGPHDRAAHSANGRRTPRNEVMWGPPGYAYVYLVYGMHHCFNVVAAGAGKPEAVLVRAVEPLVGIDLMRRRRALCAGAPDHGLARGPGNLCRAMGIERRHNGADLLDGALRLERGPRLLDGRIGTAARVGIGYAGPDTKLPWRLFERGNPHVSALAAGERRIALGPRRA